MEPIFENKFLCTKDYYKEYYRYLYFKRPIIIVFNIILIISFISNILMIVFPKLSTQNNNITLANIASVLIIFGIQIYLYISNVNLAYNRDLERNKGNCIEIKLSITEDGINILTNLENDIKIEFKNIEKVIKTKNYYILVSKAKIIIALKKDAFIKGTSEEFEKFLKEKNLIKR